MTIKLTINILFTVMDICCKKTEIKTLCNQALKLSKFDLEKSHNLGRKALYALESLNITDKEVHADVYHTLQVIYYIKADYKLSYSHGKMALNNLETLKNDIDIKLKSKIYNFLSLAAYILCNYDKEYSFAMKSKELAQKTNSNSLKHRALTTLAFCSHYKNSPDKQLELLERSKELANISNDKLLLAKTFNNFTHLFIKKTNFEKAKYYLDKCRSYIDEDTPIQALAIYKCTEGEYEMHLGHYDKALEYYSESLALHKESPFPLYLFEAITLTATTYFKQTKHSKAIRFLNSFIKSFEIPSLKIFKAKIFKLISKNYEELREYNKALSYYKEYCQIINKADRDIDLNKECLDLIHYVESVKQESSIVKFKNKKHKEKINKIQNEMETNIDSTLQSILGLVKTRSIETNNHINRTKHFFHALAELLIIEGVYKDELNNHNIMYMSKAAAFHDIGKIGVPDYVLQKKGDLTTDEFEIMKRHTTAGFDALKNAQSQVGDNIFFSYAINIAHSHHENWNGSGYPLSLKKSEIPLCGRIMAVIDNYDALISKRTYKDPIPHSNCIKIISSDSGIKFDPIICDIFVKNHEVFKGIAVSLVDCYEEYDALLR